MLTLRMNASNQLRELGRFSCAAISLSESQKASSILTLVLCSPITMVRFLTRDGRFGRLLIMCAHRPQLPLSRASLPLLLHG